MPRIHFTDVRTYRDDLIAAFRRRGISYRRIAYAFKCPLIDVWLADQRARWREGTEAEADLRESIRSKELGGDDE
jgi:hypothetical protein